MWGLPLVSRYPDVLDFVGLCDVNPLRAEAARKAIGVACPTFTSLDEMLTTAKPDLLCVTTVDAFHSECLILRKVEVPDYLRVPGSRAGALSCLTGIAARKSVDEGRPVKIADLVSL